MAFFDKLNQVAKNIGDKASDTVETTKLNSKIKAERQAAAELLEKIGEYYYNLYAAGGEVAPEVLELCQTAKGHYENIQNAQNEIERIKAENEAPAPAVAAAPASAGGTTCPACGTANAPGTKFCQGCGNNLQAAPAAPAGIFCPGCGAQVQPGIKFCNQCGYKMFE